MKRHLVLLSGSELQNIISGQAQYLIRFFKKRLEFISGLEKGDLIYLRKGGEVPVQFTVGRLVLIEGIEKEDYKMLKEFSKDLNREVFERKMDENSIIVIIQIQKLEQLITSPVEVPYNLRKEWLVLDD